MPQKMIAMLRGINVGGHRKVPMADLREAFADAGFGEVQTYVQSGNVVFDGGRKSPKKLSQQLESLIRESFGFDVPVVVREYADLKRIVASNPFLQRPKIDTKHLSVTFWREQPTKANLSTFAAPDGIEDEVAVGTGEVFAWCPGSFARTKLTNNFFEKQLGVSCTSRNWKTVLALEDMASR